MRLFGKRSYRPSQRLAHYARPVPTGLLAVLTCVALISTASAQPGDRERRKQFFEGLFQTLVETQMERHLKPPAETPRPIETPVPRQVIQARALLTTFADESQRVSDAVQADAVRVPGARALLGDVLRLRAEAAVAARQAQKTQSIETITDSARNLDRKWRLIHHRLKQVDGLSPASLQRAGELNQVDLELSQLLQIQAQIDGRELLRLADSLGAELANMVGDIEIELQRTRESKVLAIEARRVQQQARYLSDTISRGQSYNTIVAEFRKFHTAYSSLAADLWTLNNRYLERSMRRIEETDRQIHTLLWLPQPLSRQQLQHLTSVLTQRVDDLFDRVTLNMLITSPSAANVLNTASQFYGCCEHYAAAVRGNGTAAQLRSDFQCVQEAWPELVACFRGVRDDEVDQLLKEIGQTFLSMRDALQIQVEFDRRAAIDVVAALESQLEHLAADVRREVGAGSRFPRAFQQQAVQGCEALQAAAGDLHQELLGNTGLDHLREGFTDVHRSWSLYYERYIDKMGSEPNSHLHETAEQVTPLVVQLQTMMPY